MFKTLVSGAVAFMLTSAAASAATFEFEYDVTTLSQTLAGFFTAEETVPGFLTITDIYGVTLDGNPTPAITSLGSAFDSGGGLPIGAARVATDLSFVDVLACASAPGTGGATDPCAERFLFTQANEDDDGLYSSSPAFGGVSEILGEGGFRLVRTEDPEVIPLPATGLLLIAGLGGLAVARRRKAA